jgi:epoxyqueuosine reductase
VSLTEELRRYGSDRGVDLIGCTSTEPFEVGRERRVADPVDVLSGARAVVVGACYVFGFERHAPSTPGSPRGRFGPWTRASLAAHAHGKQVISSFLGEAGFQVADSGDLPLKMAAVRSGIAQYGKNCIVHAGGYGSYLKLSGIVTDAPLDCADEPVESSDCGDCAACVDACPTGALREPYRLDMSRCVCAWLWGRPVAPEDRPHVGNHIFRCRYCQDACPKNSGLVPRREFPFPVEEGSDCPELIPLLFAEEEQCRRLLPAFVMQAGLETVQRNVAIALGNTGDPAAVGALSAALSHRASQVRAAAAWALGRIGGAAAATVLRSAAGTETDDSVAAEIRTALTAVGP